MEPILRFLVKYCAYEAPLADAVTEDTFDTLEELHERFFDIVSEQFVFHEEWEVSTSGPLRRKDHEMSQQTIR